MHSYSSLPCNCVLCINTKCGLAIVYSVQGMITKYGLTSIVYTYQQEIATLEDSHEDISETGASGCEVQLHIIITAYISKYFVGFQILIRIFKSL